MSAHCEIAKVFEIQGPKWEEMVPAERQFFCLTLQAKSAQLLAAKVELAMLPPTSIYVSPARKLENGNYEIGCTVLVQRLLPTACPDCHRVHRFEDEEQLPVTCVQWKFGPAPHAQHMVIEEIQVPDGV